MQNLFAFIFCYLFIYFYFILLVINFCNFPFVFEIQGKWVSMGVYSDGSYRIPKDIEEGKLCKLWNKAQQAQWACWQAQNVHIHMPNEARAHPLAWAPSQDEGPDLPITF